MFTENRFGKYWKMQDTQEELLEICINSATLHSLKYYLKQLLQDGLKKIERNIRFCRHVWVRECVFMCVDKPKSYAMHSIYTGIPWVQNTLCISSGSHSAVVQIRVTNPITIFYEFITLRAHIRTNRKNSDILNIQCFIAWCKLDRR